jgi:hypothetical protein
MNYSHGECSICHERNEFLMPLHGEQGGPACCLVCRGKWHAEHGKRRRLGRVVIRAMMAFIDGGGFMRDLDKLKVTAITHDVFEIDPLGYLAGAAKLKDEVIELTSELLADTLKLVHPDMHPPERRESAHRVTQGLLAIQPFVLPAPTPKPKPAEERTPSAVTPKRQVSRERAKEPLPFPCPECADTTPFYYCDACKTEKERRDQAERDHRADLRRRSRAQRKSARSAKCVVCGERFSGKRRDARFCSSTCRQRAHRRASQLNVSPTTQPPSIRDARLVRHSVTMRDGKLYVDGNELTLPWNLRIENGRLRRESSISGPYDFRPGHDADVSFVVNGRKQFLRLQMCDDCDGLFAGHYHAWRCDLCARAAKDKAVAKAHAKNFARPREEAQE